MTMNVAARLFAVASENPDAPALWARGELLTYSQLMDEVISIAAGLKKTGLVRRGDRVAFLTNRTKTAYASLLAPLFAGATYVPLNTRFPDKRNRSILETSGATALIVDQPNLNKAQRLIESLPVSITVLAPETVGSDLPNPNWMGKDELPSAAEWSFDSEFCGDTPVYLMFTSGSTGKPKGVPISHLNLLSYVENITNFLGGVEASDRIIQLADLTFDISVHDIFVCFLNGASLYSVPENAALMGPRFVQENQLTGWFSVPSTAGLLRQKGQLDTCSMPSLRFTLFCGEALPSQVAEAWAIAAPHSAIYNLYGPTEATVAFSGYRYHAGQSDPPPVVPLGHPFPGQEIGLFEPGQSVAAKSDGTGEMCLSGSQVMAGYWGSSELNSVSIFEVNGCTWYRTGDLGTYESQQGWAFVGRVDHQVKIRGFRVELQEIEIVLRKLSGRALVAAVPWPVTQEAGATGCVAFVAGDPQDTDLILEGCRGFLPDYMVPSAVIFLDNMPVNSNNKVDYQQLLVKLKNRSQGH